MTLKSLRSWVESQQQSTEEPAMLELKKRLHNRPFWIWAKLSHDSRQNIHNIIKGNCCFNHVIGLPKKDGKEFPLFSYEKLLYDALMVPGYINSRPRITKLGFTMEEHREKEQRMKDDYLYDFKLKHLWVKKATGLGVTEFMLRFMAWLCLKNDDYKDSQMCIITGPNQDIAIKSIKRMKGLFTNHGITFDSKETVIELNGCSIEAYPSNHIDAFRSLTNPKFILIDEGDFFRKNEQEDVRHVAERYIAKSDPFIVMVSTPNAPGGLFQKIEQEPFESSIYKKVFLDYTYGVDKIYSKAEIDKAKKSPSFPREYELQYLGLVGNVFSPKSIEGCQSIEYNPELIVPCKVSIGIDPSFGSSKFGIVATRFVNERIEVVIAEEHDRPDFNAMIDRVWEIKKQISISAIYVDAANPEIWQSLKKEFKESYSDHYVSEKLVYCKKHNVDPNNYMIVIPVPFSHNQGAAMLQHAKSLVEDKDNLVAIDKRYDKLLTALRTAVANEYKLDKEATSYHDILDAFRLSLQFYRRNK
jgi:hypothetical protein